MPCKRGISVDFCCLSRRAWERQGNIREHVTPSRAERGSLTVWGSGVRLAGVKRAAEASRGSPRLPRTRPKGRVARGIGHDLTPLRVPRGRKRIGAAATIPTLTATPKTTPAAYLTGSSSIGVRPPDQRSHCGIGLSANPACTRAIRGPPAGGLVTGLDTRAIRPWVAHRIREPVRVLLGSAGDVPASSPIPRAPTLVRARRSRQGRARQRGG